MHTDTRLCVVAQVFTDAGALFLTHWDYILPSGAWCIPIFLYLEITPCHTTIQTLVKATTVSASSKTIETVVIRAIQEITKTVAF